jgi:AraC-like DNA-binding protein
VVRSRLLTGIDLAPLRVQFRHAAPADITEHRRIFRCPVEFGGQNNVLTLSRAQLEFPIATSDVGLRAILDRHADEILARLPRLGLVPKTRAALADALAAGTPTLAAVAKRMRTSTRTLQRRLAEDGVRFDDLLDGLRRELAIQHLGDARLTVAEVGFLLGYNDATAFHRAFRRWMGCTPQTYRLKH